MGAFFVGNLVQYLLLLRGEPWDRRGIADGDSTDGLIARRRAAEISAGASPAPVAA